ncbi:MAG TPA: ABC transporter permease, partial [Candidatus Methylomirabilis sp.]|nr:ABC transporter permease [Candidatus Methylomirabilis sp.]
MERRGESGSVETVGAEGAAPIVSPATGGPAARAPRRADFGERLALLRHSRVAWAGLAVVLCWVLVAALAPLLSPYSPTALVAPVAQPPSAQHVLGTDQLGRDVLSRLIWGSRVILLLAPAAVLCALAVGTLLGLVAGTAGRLVDEVVMRLLDAILAFPPILLYLVVIAAVGPSALNIVLALTLGSAPGIARIVRSLVLDLRTREFVTEARLRGESRWYIMLVEMLPNVKGPLIVDGCIRLGYATFAIGTLGFLGLGLPPPAPDWGRMVNDGRNWILTAPWMVLAPAVAISSLVVGLNLFADG